MIFPVALRGLLLALLGLQAVFSMAQSDERKAGSSAYPVRPVRIVVPFPAGASPNDITARLIGQKLSESLGQQFVVDNRPGAGGTIGMGIVAKANPDGYTILISSVPFTVTPSLYKNVTFNTQNDFLPVTMIATAPLLLVVNPSLPIRTVQDLIAYAKANAGRFNYSAGPAGTTSHLAAELLKVMTGMDARFVSYKGGAPALVSVISGETSMMLESSTSTLSFVKDGKLRALAVTSKKRSFAIPEIPTIEEAGVPGYVFEVWYGFFVPAGTPAPVIGRLQAEVRRALATAFVKERLAAMGTEPVGSTPEAFQMVLQTEFRKWAKLVKDAHISIE